MATDRFQDSGAGLGAFADEFVVECPGCGESARVSRRWKLADRCWSGGRFACVRCGSSRRSPENSPITVAGDAAVDRCFGLPLFLQTRCANHVLWAYNARHLAFIKAYLSAKLREKHATNHASAAARLPGWIKRNRNQALRAIRRLERKL